VRVLCALASTALVLGGAASSDASGESWGVAVPVVQPAFTAAMPDRFGADADADGVVDMPNTAQYVQGCPEGCRGAVRFTLRLDASASRASLSGAPLPLVGYHWRVTGAAGLVAARVMESPVVEFRLPEGTYRVTLDVQAALGWGTATARVGRDVVVEDLLVVAIGDSYASGDGSPERPREALGQEALWGDAPGDPAAQAAHAAAHRSTAAWPSLAALALERADPGTSVTFVSVATTGARVSRGLLPATEGSAEPGQLDQVAALVGERTIDALLVSVGGNDVGFTRIVRGLVDADPQADPVCYEVDLENVWRSATDGDWNRGSALRFSFPSGLGCRETVESGRPILPGLEGLPARLDELAAAIEATLAAPEVYLMEYGDPTGGADGRRCPEIAGDLTPPFGFHEIDTAEQEAAVARVLAPLNRVLEEAASRHGWNFVGELAEAFGTGHGYCAEAPRYGAPTAYAAARAPVAVSAWYRHPMQENLAGFLARPGVSWYRTAAQSVALQGPSARWDTTGTMHPNELGHLAMARAVLEAMGVADD